MDDISPEKFKLQIMVKRYHVNVFYALYTKREVDHHMSVKNVVKLYALNLALKFITLNDHCRNS